MSERLARSPVNDAYERGWREGWAAALSRIEEDGIDVVREREQMYCAPVPMTLALEGAETACPCGSHDADEANTC